MKKLLEVVKQTGKTLVKSVKSFSNEDIHLKLEEQAEVFSKVIVDTHERIKALEKKNENALEKIKKLETFRDGKDSLLFWWLLGLTIAFMLQTLYLLSKLNVL